MCVWRGEDLQVPLVPRAVESEPGGGRASLRPSYASMTHPGPLRLCTTPLLDSYHAAD